MFLCYRCRTIPNISIALSENEDDDICLVNASVSLSAGRKVNFTRSSLKGTDIEDVKIDLGFPTIEGNTTITISKISIFDARPWFAVIP